ARMGVAPGGQPLASAMLIVGMNLLLGVGMTGCGPVVSCSGIFAARPLTTRRAATRIIAAPTRRILTIFTESASRLKGCGHLFNTLSDKAFLRPSLTTCDRNIVQKQLSAAQCAPLRRSQASCHDIFLLRLASKKPTFRR